MHRLAFQVMARMETTKTLNDVKKRIGSNFGGGFPNLPKRMMHIVVHVFLFCFSFR
jgi:hypothetical protein